MIVVAGVICGLAAEVQLHLQLLVALARNLLMVWQVLHCADQCALPSVR